MRIIELFAGIGACSKALTNLGIDLEIVDAVEIDKYAIEGEWIFPDDMITDQPERQIAAEFIREKLLRLLSDEIPHGIAVVIGDSPRDCGGH